MPTVDANLLVDDNGVTRPLQVSDLADAALGTKLDALLTELTQKLEAGQPVALDATTLAAVATAAKQDAAKTTLDAISAALAHGTYGYAAGTVAGTIDVPATARVKRVSVIAGASVAATVTIAGGATITIPAGSAFDEQIPGDATAGGDVVIGGTVQAFYVSWVA